MANFAQGKIEIFLGPVELGAPDDLETVIIEFINKAKYSLDIAVQELDNKNIAQAILNAVYRGIKVKMFLEQDYIKEKKPPKIKQRENQTLEEAREIAQWTEKRKTDDTRTNRDILTALLRCGIDVKADINPEIFHQKFIIRDYRNGKTMGRAAVLTGSTNFTDTGTHKNLNNVIVLHDYRICRVFEEEFDELRSGTFGSLQERRPKFPKTINIKGVPVRILFAPDNSPELEIVKQMLKADKQLDFAIFTFSSASGIDDAMAILRRAGVKIIGVLDRMQGLQTWSATKWLHNRGIKIFFPDKNQLPGLGKLHHKLLVIDEAIVITGSMNYTPPANEFNDENIVVLGSPYDLPKSKGGIVNHDECKAIAQIFRNEIIRISKHSIQYQE